MKSQVGPLTTRVSIKAFQGGLEDYVRRVEQGESFVLCRDGAPVAEVVPSTTRSQVKRPIGLGKGLIQIPDSFFDPLPDDELRAFEGKWD